MNYHGQIMNAPPSKAAPRLGPARIVYAEGHRDARHAAAEIALKADAEIEALKGKVEQLQKAYLSMRNTAAGYSNLVDYTLNTRRLDADYLATDAAYRQITAGKV